ncbi:hypothetical protein GDO86_013655 [Hymenochirus boettgeri]|uniref:Alpha-2-macroglobulin n=1 Tax=Hymenochirus boettgeri TaxID=247094 RepID=A0A8T2IXI5_9PIPI|nr:hypothetical protein GDO86_013655 [Hymenochirus boettgeri]
MWISKSLTLSLLLTVLPGGEPSALDPQYMLLVPTVLHGGEEKFCLVLSHLNETVNVSLTLELSNKNETLLEKQVTETEENICTTFPIPESENIEVGYITLLIDGETLNLKSRRSFLIKPSQTLVFIQTDKPIYKPGQKVQFRIAALDEKFHPVSQKDPQDNRIGQWLNVETKKGIVQEAFQLSSEPALGKYTVTAQKINGTQVIRRLPKYKVDIMVPPIITVLDNEIKVTVCGKYTYGKPVLGKIDIRVCRKFTDVYNPCPNEEDSMCEEISQQADSNGCCSKEVNTKIFQLRRRGYEMKITASAIITEDGTGVELTGEGSSSITPTVAKVSFRKLDSHYKRGLPIYGQLFLEDAGGKPISNETVVVFVDRKTNFTYTTGQDGTAEFSIDTSSFPLSSVTIQAMYKKTEACSSYRWMVGRYEEAVMNIQHFYSRSGSHLKIQPIYGMLKCRLLQDITVHYILTPKGIGESNSATFHFLVMAKGAIVQNGKHTVAVTPNQESHGDLSLTSLIGGVDISPVAKVLVYLIMDSGEVIADSITLNVEKCFENTVKLSFSPSEALPGSQANLHLHTGPGSLCAVRAIDESVLLLKPEEELSAETVYNLLPLQDLSGYIHNGKYLEDLPEEPCLSLDPIFMNGVYYSPSTPSADKDTYKILESLGLKVFTNTVIRIPVVCGQERRHYSGVSDDIPMAGSAGLAYAVPMSMSMTVQSQPTNLPSVDMVETVRQYFPETWLWNLVETNSEGKADMELTVPDTITTWKAGMFCTSEKAGFGLSETVSLVSFQPFFLDLTLPYSAIRGEKFTLKASVFNYLSQTIRVRLLLEDSVQFLAKPASVQEEVYCITANGQVTMSVDVTLKSLGEVNFTVSAETMTHEGLCANEIVNPTQGRKDTVTKNIVVEPEGVEKEEARNAMICQKGSEITEEISLKLPERVVEGSARAYFSVIGDVLGTAMQNLGNLLQMPFGCGEQNLVLFTPNIYILDYLNKTNQLTPEIKTKALNYMTSGYQKQLAYKHIDGSYSAFGSPYEAGNTWLTAFTMKSFARARDYIYIDETLILQALTWLSNRQKANGCFQSVGTLFNNAMKGGVDDEISLTAYITIALLEYPLPITHFAVRNALFCLENAPGDKNSVYTKALLAYAFSLAGKTDIRNQLLKSLDELALKKDGMVHWERPDLPHNLATDLQRIPYSRAASVEVEMTSYVLLALLSKPEISDEDLTLATQIVSWIIKQQNPSGGFSSTQDTVIALQALALYGSHTVQQDASQTLSLSLDKSPLKEFTVEDSNRLLLQSFTLKKIPGDYTATVKGSGCLYLKTTLKYNIPHPEEDAAFSITVKTDPETCNPKSLKSFAILANVSYVGNKENSNMAIVEIKLPSGYIPVKSSVKNLRFLPHLIRRTETKPNKVIVYFHSLSKLVQSFRFLVEQDILMSNLQPATAIVYDYYEQGDFAVTKYDAPCSRKDGENKLAEIL